jgi:sarcosine oxidase subunit gamma
VAKYTLTPRTAFGATHALDEQVGLISLVERPGFSIASVTARKDAQDIAKKLTGHSDVPVGNWREVSGRMVFWTGPNQWFVLDAHNAHETLSAEIKGNLGDAVSVTEQNDGWVVFDLKGEGIEAVLERLCNIDLSQFEQHKVQRTVIEHVGCFVLCLQKDKSYRFLCGRSFAQSFAHGIKTIMASVAAQKLIG